MSDILKNLNPEQLKAVTTTEGPILIIAGAGTGKTTVIANRIAFIIEKKLAKPQEILALTFTDKAAAEMEERVDVLVPYGFIDTWISTFHAFGDRVLRENAFDLGLSPDFKVMSRPQQVLFFQQNLFRFNLDYYRPLGNPTKFISAILTFFSRLKDENVSPDEFKKFAKSKRRMAKGDEAIDAEKYVELANCYQSYEQSKFEAGLLDFGDQVVKTLELFQRRPKILKNYQQQFKYVLVDEYQDTNYSQNELVKLIAQKSKNICVVGDDDQCLPPGTLVTTPTGSRRIEILKKGEEVLTAVGKGHLGVSKITKVFKSKKNARFLTITTKSGQKLTLTDNHKVFCYVPSKMPKSQHHYVYLMYRQNLGWRIGVTNDLSVRLKLERSADKIIGVKAFKTDQEARYHEMLWTLKYGIPPTIFKERSNAIVGELLLRLYKDIDTQNGAQRLAKDLNLDLNSPHYTLDAVTRGQSHRVKINLTICARNHRSKTQGILKSPKITHALNLQTSNPSIIKILQAGGYKLEKAKKGLRLRIQSIDLPSLGKIAENLSTLTGGFIEPKFSLGFASVQSKPALVMPASNLLPGHRLPIVKGSRIYYDEIIDIKEEQKYLTVYDLEIDRTHNFVANGIVVHNSIYKFRGAAISNILEFQKTFTKSAQVVLTQNYRSTQSILDSAYKLVHHNDPDRLEVTNKIDKKLRSTTSQGIPPQELFTETLSEEADMVVAEIEKLISRKKAKSQLSTVNSYQYRDMAILVRANSQADHFIRALNMKGIPHKFVGSSGLYQQEEVQVLISFLTSITNFEDSLNLFNLLTSEVYEMPIGDAIKLTSYSRRKNRPLYYILKSQGSDPKPQRIAQGQDEAFEKGRTLDDLEISTKSQAIIEKFNTDLDEAIESSAKLSAGRILYNFLQKTGYLKKLDKGGIEGQIKIQNIAKFFEKIKEFESVTSASSTNQFVDYLEAIRSAGDDPATVEFDPDLNAVNVMTVHGAKGLEFPVVFMVGLVSDRFPTRSRSEAIEIPSGLIKETLPAGDWHLQEERRLFYVGVTRAKNLLYFSWSRDAGGVRVKKISPFILEALDQVKPQVDSAKLSPKEKIEKFAPVPPITRQTVMFDVDVLKLTQGSIDDYLTCAYKYRYVHILKVPIMRHHAIAYGSALHSAVGAFLTSKKNGKLMPLAQVLEVFENAWDSEGFLTIEHEEKRKALGKLALSSFWRRESKSKDMPSLIESKFSFSLSDVTIVGRFDRVDVKPGSKIEIIDYKSSENIDQVRADAQAKESTQLGVYALYYWKKHGIIPERVALHFLENGIEGGYAPTQKDLEKTEKLILTTAEKIRNDTKNNKFIANPKYFGREPACNYCAYNSICQFSLAKV